MPRVARIVIPGCPHHITQRGNNRQDVFFVDGDRVRYLEILAEQSERFGLTVDGYCLMTNHVHLVATPAGPESLAKAVGRTHWLYTQYVNRLHGRCGHLWQNRFYSCTLDETHFWPAMVYVERNPVRAKRVRRAWEYPWSSAAAHCGVAASRGTADGGGTAATGGDAAATGGDAGCVRASKAGTGTSSACGLRASQSPFSPPAGLLDLAAWANMLPPDGTWRDSLAEPTDEALAAKLRLWTHRGRPLGSDRFVAKLERLVGRRLRPLPVGRPKKKKPANATTKTKKQQPRNR